MDSRFPDPTMPTAEVRQLDRVAQAKALYEEFANRERMNLKTAWELGKLLCEIKEKAGHGNWIAERDRTGIPQQRVSEYMRLAQITGTVICSFTSIAAALESLEPEPGTLFEPKGTKQLCKRCQRVGMTRGCQACAELQKPLAQRLKDAEALIAQLQEKKKAPGGAGSEPGNVTPKDPLKEFRKLWDKLVRTIDDFEKLAGCPNSPEGNEQRELLKDWREWMESLYRSRA